MWKILAVLLVVPFTAWADNPDGTWLVSQRIAFEIFPCRDDLCGKIVWLRNPQLRTSANCGRTIVWGLTATSPTEWDDGWFYDPENGKTYNVRAHADSPDRITARIYDGIPFFGRTENLSRIAPHSLEGWCS